MVQLSKAWDLLSGRGTPVPHVPHSCPPPTCTVAPLESSLWRLLCHLLPTPSCTSGLVVSTDPGLCLVLNYKDDVPWGCTSHYVPVTALPSSYHPSIPPPHSLHSHLDL